MSIDLHELRVFLSKFKIKLLSDGLLIRSGVQTLIINGEIKSIVNGGQKTVSFLKRSRGMSDGSTLERKYNRSGGRQSLAIMASCRGEGHLNDDFLRLI